MHDMNAIPETRRTSWMVWVLTAPFLLLALFLLWLIWTWPIGPLARIGYTAAFFLVAYWLYTPKSPRHIIARQIMGLVIVWGIVVMCAMTWAMMEGRPEVFGPGAGVDMVRFRMMWAFWIGVFLLGAILATRRIYKSLDRNIHLANLFSRYVAPSVIAEMLKSREDFFATKKTELTVVFVDLRGFTSTSSKLAAEQVRDLINIFMEVMIPVAHTWRGTVDKTVGDEIMILFGAPLPYPDHADQGMRGALKLLEAHARVSDEWRRRGLPVLEMGVGINTGEMVVGNIGCRERVDYTVLGHHVNLAARLCGKAAGSQILVSEFTRAALSPEMRALVPADSAVELEVKNIAGTVKAFAVGVRR